MPLPDNGATWPPPHLAPVLRDIAVDDAWYSGDRQRLTKVYERDERRQDGRRRLWSRRPEPGRRDRRMHVPLAGDIASTSASLLFSEPPAFTCSGTDAQARLAAILDEGGAVMTLLEAAEVCAALGGVYLRATWDASLARRPLLTVVHADGAVPEYRWGELTAVTFWRELPGPTPPTVLRAFERHIAGLVEHGLYEGTADNVGRRVPLTEHPATAVLAASLGTDGDTVETGIDRITAAYVPNIRPNRRHRGSAFGQSDYRAVHDLFDMLDTTWSSWVRDIRLARARLIVPDGYLRDHGPGQGTSFDDDREVWAPLAIPPTEGGAITLNQFAIRVDEHERTADAVVRQTVELAGYSAQSFGLGGDAAATATEVTARERRSMITRDHKAGYWRPALAHMGEVLLALDRARGWSTVTPERPAVRFGDGVSEDPQAVAQTLALLAQAQAVSTDTRVRILHPDWDDTAVAGEVDRILVETGALVPDPL